MRIDNKKFWCVRNPTEHSELGDVCFETDLKELPLVVHGTGGPKWHAEQLAFYDNQEEAREDAKGRMARRKLCDAIIG